MQRQDFTQGLLRARFHPRYLLGLFAEMAILAVAFGVICKSWQAALLMAAILLFLLYIKPLTLLLVGLLSLGWGLTGFGIGALTGSGLVMVGLSLLGAVGGFVVHWLALKRDVAP